MESLTEAVLRYQDTEEGYQVIIERMSLIIYNYPDKLTALTEEDKCDFYLGFYSRINGLIKNFTYTGRPFEALLHQSLKWHGRTFLAERKKEKQLQAVEIQEEEIKIKNLLEDSGEENEIQNMKYELKNNAARKRLLYLILLDAPNISDREFELFSRMTGFDLSWLLDLKDKINNIIYNRSGRLSELREKRNSYYSRKRYYQILLADETDRNKREKISEKIATLNKRLEDTRKDIARVPVRPTHSEVASLLDIPKGTVDSGIHYFRKMNRVSKEENAYSLFS